ncbi:hypothetical protein GYH30_011585 [Glycine max]|nr:hypothetical protein GYH30_011585 [Glycine max]
MEVFMEGREAKVEDLQVIGTIQEEVLWLEVAMGDVVAMAEAEHGDELCEVAVDEGLREAFVAREP